MDAKHGDFVHVVTPQRPGLRDRGPWSVEFHLEPVLVVQYRAAFAVGCCTALQDRGGQAVSDSGSAFDTIPAAAVHKAKTNRTGGELNSPWSS